MSTVNKTILIGNLGQDPEIKTFDNGGKIATFSMATSEKWKNKDGSPGEHTEWHDVKVTFDKLADVVEKYVKKGSKLYIEGKIRTESWENNEGVKQYRKWVYASSITMLGGKSEDSQPVTTKTETPAPPVDNGEDDDLPF
jgi:single-strand DNA-binding protein